MKAHPFQNQWRNCNASWSSLEAPSRIGPSCPSGCGRLRLNWPANTACIAHPLRLDDTRLKQRLGGSPTFRQKSAQPAFVELVAPSRAPLEEWGIEFESSGGSKMRIQGKAAAPPDWTALLRAWRETKG